MNAHLLTGRPTEASAPYGRGVSAVARWGAGSDWRRGWVATLLALLLGTGGLGGLSSCGVKPLATAAATQQGLASYYGNEFQGRRTSNGEIFDQAKMTAAHRSYPFGTVVLVTNLETSATVTVRINDRGPVKPERIIDLTYAAAKALGITRQGLGKVRLNVLEWGRGKG